MRGDKCFVDGRKIEIGFYINATSFRMNPFVIVKLDRYENGIRSFSDNNICGL